MAQAHRAVNLHCHDAKVVTDDQAPYYGIKVNDQSLVPGDRPRLGAIRLEDWLRQATRK